MRPGLPQNILEFLTPHNFFSKLTIASKMLIGYATLVVLTVAVVVYALLNLQRLNTLNSEIVMVDIPIQETADRMLDALFAQDGYEKRYLLLKGKDMRGLFRRRGREFHDLLLKLKSLSSRTNLPIDNVQGLHAEYNDLFAREVRLIKAEDGAGAAALSNGELKKTFDQLLEAVRRISAAAKQSQENRMKMISHIGTSAFYYTAVLCSLSIVLGVLLGMAVTHHISSSINKLRIATARISEGDFQYDPGLATRDEIGALAQAFVVMGRRLKMLEEMYLDASPLTRLPGGIAIESVLKRRLESGQPFAFCVLDLDNFKIFNDHYGHVHGNTVIKETASIIETATKENGSPDDFVGHVGGDDFVVITTPKYMREICSEIIRVFDGRIPQFYDQKDRENGFILGKNRQGQELRFPLMTISIAIVTNEQRSIISPLEASELAAELKDHAKTLPSSVYVVDKRRSA